LVYANLGLRIPKTQGTMACQKWSEVLIFLSLCHVPGACVGGPGVRRDRLRGMDAGLRVMQGSSGESTLLLLHGLGHRPGNQGRLDPGGTRFLLVRKHCRSSSGNSKVLTARR
jgi:hypothetical protein